MRGKTKMKGKIEQEDMFTLHSGILMLREKPYQKESETSWQATRTVNAGEQRQKVLIYLRTLGKTGATREEIAKGLNLPLSSVCPRVWELIKNTDEICETSERRKTSSGKNAVVLRIKD